QTHHLEGVAPRGMGVQVPPSAPNVQLILLGASAVPRKVDHGLSLRHSSHHRKPDSYWHHSSAAEQKRRSCRSLRRPGIADRLRATLGSYDSYQSYGMVRRDLHDYFNRAHDHDAAAHREIALGALGNADNADNSVEKVSVRA